MYKINVTVKNLDGFSLSVEEMDKVLRPDVDEAKKEDVFQHAWNEYVTNQPTGGDSFRLESDDSAQYTDSLFPFDVTKCETVDDGSHLWGNDPRNVDNGGEYGICYGCHQTRKESDMLPFDVHPGLTVNMCKPCAAKRGFAYSGIWHQRNNPGGPDEVPTATEWELTPEELSRYQNSPSNYDGGWSDDYAFAFALLYEQGKISEGDYINALDIAERVRKGTLSIAQGEFAKFAKEIGNPAPF